MERENFKTAGGRTGRFATPAEEQGRMSASASRLSAALRRDPLLPPGFTLVTLRESGDAFAHAAANAAELGAATLVWVRRFDLLEFAVVLEPEAPLATARLAHYMGMNALADMMAAHCPPERAVYFEWPDALLLDHGLLGGGRTAWPADCPEDREPEWIVFGAMLRTVATVDFESGLRRAGLGAGVAMDEAGFEEISPADLVESFCRHLMLNVDQWSSRGPKAVVKRWLDRIAPEVGRRQGVEPNGDLVVRTQEGESRRSFVEALARAEWYDPARAEPKL